MRVLWFALAIALPLAAEPAAAQFSCDWTVVYEYAPDNLVIPLPQRVLPTIVFKGEGADRVLEWTRLWRVDRFDAYPEDYDERVAWANSGGAFYPYRFVKLSDDGAEWRPDHVLIFDNEVYWPRCRYFRVAE